MPIRSQVLIAAGGLLALLAMSMAVAIIPVMNLNHDRTHLSDRDMRYLNAAAAAAVNAIAIPVSRLMAVLRVDMPSRGSA